ADVAASEGFHSAAVGAHRDCLQRPAGRRRGTMRTRNGLAVILSIATLVVPRPAPAIAQRTGDFELEIDAPWRMQPRGPSNADGAIPIQVSIPDPDQPATFMDGKLQQIINVTQTEKTGLQAGGAVDTAFGVAEKVDAFNLRGVVTFAMTAILDLFKVGI